MRSLMNVRQPLPVSEQFLKAQDAELCRQQNEKGTVILTQISVSVINKRLKLRPLFGEVFTPRRAVNCGSEIRRGGSLCGAGNRGNLLIPQILVQIYPFNVKKMIINSCAFLPRLP